MTAEAARVATAKALLNAGNLLAAEREALALLEQDPDDPQALDILFCIKLQNDEGKRALALAESWVERTPDCSLAHYNRICALLQIGRTKKAHKAAEAYKQDFPLDTLRHDILELLVLLKSGKARQLHKRLNALRKVYGTRADFNWIEAVALCREESNISASRAADRVLQADPLDAKALNVKAYSAFRLCRLAEARRLARQIRELDPQMGPEANEMIYASYAAYFPPFFLAQLILVVVFFVQTRFRSGFLTWVIFSHIGAPLVFPIIFSVEHLADWTGIPNFRAIFYGSLFAWLVYRFFCFQKISRRWGKAKSISLSSEY